jgi:AcrR family transcriptional regulator
MPRSEQTYEEIRERTTRRILEAAGKVIARKGRTATMAELAAEAGVSQGLAYRYFSSKEEIFYELLRQMWRSGGVINEGAQDAPEAPRKRLGTIIDRSMRLRRDHPEFYQFLFQALIDDKLPDDVRKSMKDQEVGVRNTMRRLIVEGQASNEIVNDDPDQLVDAIMACLDGLSRKMVSLSTGEVRMQLPESRIILRMLGPEPPGGVRQ